MTDEPQQKTEKPTVAGPPPAGPPPMVLIGVIVAALVAGVAAGSFLIAPRLAPAPDAKLAAHESKKKESGHGKHGEETKGAVHRIENLIVNPAGSQGTRFLMTTVAIEVPDEKNGAMLRDHDAQVRDAVISTLEIESLESLTRPGSRGALKHKIEAAVAPFAGNAAWIHVYLPQFVIQ